MGDHGSILQTIINIFSQAFIFVNSILPHEIKDLGLAIQNFTFINLTFIKDLILISIRDLNETSPNLVEALRFLKVALSVYLNIFYLFYMLRLVIYWFPNLNPYNPPLYIVLLVTQPPLTLLEKALPRVFNIDFSYIIITLSLTAFIKVLDNFYF